MHCILQDSTATYFILLPSVFVLRKFNHFRSRLPGRRWVRLPGWRWVRLPGWGRVGLPGRRWVGLAGWRWVGLPGWRWVGWRHVSRIGLCLWLPLDHDSWLRGWGLCAFSLLDHHGGGLCCRVHKVPADEKGPQPEPSTCPAETKVGYSAMCPVMMEEYNRSVATTVMMVMVMMETMMTVMMETMVTVMVMMDTMMMMTVPTMASPAPPLHRQLRFAVQDAHDDNDSASVRHAQLSEGRIKGLWQSRDCHVRLETRYWDTSKMAEFVGWK